MTRQKLALLFIVIVALLAAACTNEEEPPPTTTATEATIAVEPTSTPLPTTAPTAVVPTATAAGDAAADEPPAGLPTNMAEIVNDEGGPIAITGVVTYTNPFFTLGVASPLVILEDQAGFIDRDKDYIFPIESQTLGQITSDFYTSPFSYSVALPLVPQGAYRDVDFDDEEDTGVQVFAIAYWNNVFGDPFLEERDLGGGGWSTAYASTVTSTDPDREREIIGGTFLVYAPDDRQQFPSGFGEDGLLFTEDDPLVTLPAGYTLVHMNSEPFVFDRSQRPHVDLLEPEGAALVDYSDLSYTEAFDNLVDQLKNEYAFTEYKGIDWEALRDQFRPEMERADASGDAQRYRRALRDFAWSIPDGHVAGPFLGDEFRANVLGGIGMAIRELDDGRVLVNFLLQDGPADAAGIEFRAEITAINDVPITTWIDETISWFAPYSTAHTERLDKMLFAARFPIGAAVTVSYVNPGGAAQTAVLTASSELDSYFFWLEDDTRDGFELPVEYRQLDEGVGYVQILSFSDNDLLTVQLWERMIRDMQENNVPAIIVDMRTNGGGRGFLAAQMAAYFFQEPLILGSSSFYDKERGEFYTDPDREQTFILPPEDLRYDGQIVVLVGPSCASACEFFSYYMTLNDRGTIIGQYPTAGLGGSIDRVTMPEDEEFTFTQGRAVDPDGNIHIEGLGVAPQIRVPVTEETIFEREDAVLETAVAFLLGSVLDGGALALGDSLSGALQPGERARYTLSVAADDVFSLIFESADGETPLILRVLDENDALLGETEPDTVGGFVEVALGEAATFIVEIAAIDSTAGAAYTLTVVDDRP